MYQTRQYKRERDRGSKNTLTKARLQKLADIGFEWNTRRSQQFWHNIANTMNAKSWDAHFNALLKFKAIDGTCLVPKVYPPNPVSMCCLFDFSSIGERELTFLSF